jgi:hypothetical protein
MSGTQIKPPIIRTYQNKFNVAFEDEDKKKAEKEKQAKKAMQSDSENSVKPSDSLNLSIGQTPNYEKQTLLMNDKNEIEPKYLHRKYTEDLGINIKNLFFEMLEMLANGNNPIPYVMSDPNKQFAFSVMILIIGVLMLFFSNLMI